MMKTIVVMINVLLYSCFLNGMELVDPSKTTGEEEHHPRMSLDLTPSNLHRKNTTSGGTARNTARTPIKGIGGVEALVKARSTLLSSRGVNRSKTVSASTTTARPKLFDNEENPDQVRIDISGGNGHVNNSPINVLMSESTAVVGGLEELFEAERNSLPEEERWKLLEKFNPEVYKFAKAKGKSFEDAEMYAELLNDHDVKPSFLVKHVDNIHDVNTNNVSAEAKKHYKEMREKNLDKYNAIALNTIEEVFDKKDGKAKQHTAGSELLTVQGKKIEKQEFHFKVSMIGHAFHILFTAAIGVWAAWAEVQARLPHNGTAG